MKSKRILFISKGNNAPSTRYRAQAFVKYLEKDHWEVNFADASGSIFKKAKVLRQASKADVVVIIRKGFSAFYLNLLRKVSQKLIYDFDDAIFLNGSGSQSGNRKKRFIRSLKACDQVWAGNGYLAAEAQKYHSQVEIIPTAVDPAKYESKATKPENFFDLVWIGSSSTGKYIKECVPFMRKAAEAIPELRLKVIADFAIEDDYVNIVAVPWSEASEIDELTSSHVGVAPMTDDLWTQGKCGLKVLQYIAAGLPVISSSAGVNKEMVIDQVTGHLINQPEDWSPAIIDLYNRRKALPEMNLQAQKILTENYTVETVYQKISSCLKRL